jgi:hypothetical protein
MRSGCVKEGMAGWDNGPNRPLGENQNWVVLRDSQERDELMTVFLRIEQSHQPLKHDQPDVQTPGESQFTNLESRSEAGQPTSRLFHQERVGKFRNVPLGLIVRHGSEFERLP